MASLQHQSCVQWLEVAGDTTVDQMTHKLTFVDIASISKIFNEKRFEIEHNKTQVHGQTNNAI